MTHKLAIALLATASLAALAGTPVRAADTKDMKIALSNNYAGNSWRQSMLKSWGTITKKAVDDHIVAAADAFTTAENQATEQAAQIQNMILQGYNAIVVDAASPTALNGAVKQACDAGIVVVSFDGIVTEPCAYRIAVDFKKLGSMQIDYFKQRGLKGDLLEIRGIAGVFVDDEIHAGIDDAVAKDPDFKIVGSVHGNWTQTVAQKEVAGVLPTLPPIVAVATQGGDGFGAEQAFKEAGRPHPGDLPRQPGGRIDLVEAAEGRQRLRDHVGLHRAGLVDVRVLGRAKDPGRRERSQGFDAPPSRW